MNQEICKINKFGYCKYGAQCRFLHVDTNLILVTLQVADKDILTLVYSSENMDDVNSLTIANINMNDLKIQQKMLQNKKLKV